MIVLQSPKGWTGPKIVDGVQVEGTWRAHQVPLAGLATNPAHLRMLEEWLRSYRPAELFDANGAPRPQILELAPERRAPHGLESAYERRTVARRSDTAAHCRLCRQVPEPGQKMAESTRVLGKWLRDLFKNTAASRNFRLFGPDETASNRLDAVFEVTERTWLGQMIPGDTTCKPDGRVMEVLSEHQCQGWLEGYLLTGRHGLFACYEAFIHIVDSMFNQHAKWLEATRRIPWRRDDRVAQHPVELACLAPGPQRLLAPGSGLHRRRRQQEVERRARLSPAGCQHAAVRSRQCLRSRNVVNVIVAGKQPELQWLTSMRLSNIAPPVSEFSSSRATIPTAIPMSSWPARAMFPPWRRSPPCSILRKHLPELKIRVVNVVDLMTLQPEEEHPHGLKSPRVRHLVHDR